MKFAIAGAGFSGAVLGRRLAEAGHHVDIVDERSHVAGNCHTERDADTGVLIHRYGPHIFHTDNERVWAYITRHGDMIDFQHTVKTTVEGRVYTLPVNLLTINQLYGLSLSPSEAVDFIENERIEIAEPANFEEQALSMVGPRVYAAFLRGYTRKQWGREPSELPASILKRLPLRFNYEDSYFNHPHQAIPRHGYTEIVASILDHPLIEVSLGQHFAPGDADGYDHVIWTGPLDAWFGYDEGHLAYRTLDFEEIRAAGDFQGCSVMNYGDEDVPFTRISEHKHFAPWETHEKTIAFREFSRAAGEGDIPYYPIRLADDQALLDRYLARGRAQEGVSFVGRLATYRYLDMDGIIGEALSAADKLLERVAAGEPIDPFFIDPT